MAFKLRLLFFIASFTYVTLCSITSLVALPVVDDVDGDEVEPPLQTMTHADLVETISCINEAQNATLCKKFKHCEKKMPDVVKKEFKNCDKGYSKEGAEKCIKGEGKMFESKDDPEKIMKCMKDKSPKMDNEDKKAMKHFEKCVKELHEDHCVLTPGELL